MIQPILSLFTKPFVISFAISVLATLGVIKFFTQKGWLDNPKNNKKANNNTHTYPVPRGGGIPIFLGILTVCLIFLPLDSLTISIISALLLTLVVGVLDDIYDISPYLRLLTNIIAAVILVTAGIKMEVISNPFITGEVINFSEISLGFLSGNLITCLISILWIVWCMNVVGWSGGVEGQLPGFIIIASGVIGALGLDHGQDITQWPLIILSGALAGAFLGFLPFNFFPQQIMPGYSGKSIGGLMLGTLAILSGAKVATAILVLGIPMADGLLAIIRRFSKGKSPFWGDSQHLHHLLLKIGVPKTKIALIYWIFSILLGSIVLNLNSRQKFYAFALVFAALVAISFTLQYLLKKRKGGVN